MKYFSGFSMAALLLSICPYTYGLYELVMLVSLGIGILLLVKAFLLDRTIYHNKFFPILFLFVISYAATILLNYQSGFFSNCGQLAYTCLYFFLFFCQFSLLEENERKEILLFVLRIVEIFALVIAVVSLVMMLFQYQTTISARGGEITVGFSHRNTGMQLFGIGTSPHSLSALCLLGTAAAIWPSVTEGIRPSKGAVAASIIFILTVCAANAYAALLMLLAFTFWYLLSRGLSGLTCSGRKVRQLLRTLAMIAAGCVLVVGVYFGVQRVETWTVNHINHAVEYLSNLDFSKPGIEEPQPGTDTPQPGTEDPQPGTEIPQPGTEEPKPDITISRELSTTTNGVRSSLWKEGFKLLLAHPFGVTNSNISVKIFYGVPDYEYRNLHNGYMTLLVGAGIIGFLLIMVFGVMLLYRAMRALVTCPDSRKSRYLALVVSVCVAILAGDLVNGCFVLWRGTNYILLWLLLGEAYGLTASGSPQITEEGTVNEFSAAL